MNATAKDHFLAYGDKMTRFTCLGDNAVRVSWSVAGVTFKQKLVSVPEARRVWSDLRNDGYKTW